jgi:addiction module HigA family antidote
MKDFIQHNPPHPGEILLEYYLEPLGSSVTQAAEKLLISRPRLSDIINGKAGISPAMALKLSRAFNNTPYLWMNMQTSYDLWHAQKGSKEVNKVKALV